MAGEAGPQQGVDLRVGHARRGDIEELLNGHDLDM
jgi:hypothetical protein